ncbi:MAG: FliM/FliN family flagellar motor switch protein [Mariprofundales bacterium]|nr:FliM/FliN family flagellar motor switch protein [Mariprofundales bacterium]
MNDTVEDPSPETKAQPKPADNPNGPILDPEEIRALMAVVDQDEATDAVLSSLPPLPQPKDVEPFEFLSDDDGGPQRYPLFVNLQERFGENIKDMFSDIFQHDVTILFEDLSQKSYRDIIRDERKQVFFAFEAEGSGRMMISIDIRLIVSAIDAMLGGEGESVTEELSTLTPVEMKLAERVADLIMRQLEMLWLPVQRMTFKLLKLDTDPQFLAVAGANDPCFSTEFSAQWQENIKGVIGLHYPRTFLEPIMEFLRAAVSDEAVTVDEEWTEQMEDSLKTVAVNLQLNMGFCSMTIGQFLAIKNGDYLPFTVPEGEPATLSIETLPLFRARPGSQDGMLAAELLEPIDLMEG